MGAAFSDCCTTDDKKPDTNANTVSQEGDDDYSKKNVDDQSATVSNVDPSVKSNMSTLTIGDDDDDNREPSISVGGMSTSMVPPYDPDRDGSGLNLDDDDNLQPDPKAQDPITDYDDDDDDDNDNNSNNNNNAPQQQQQSNGYTQVADNDADNDNAPGYDDNNDDADDLDDPVVIPPKPKHRQVIILENDELREKSVKLVTGDNKDFIKFLKKILKSKLSDKIWSKCDPDKTDKIETDKFMYFWTLPVTLFKVAVHQRKIDKVSKPKIDNKELKKEFQHLAIWIIRMYGDKQDDGSCKFVLEKDNYAKVLIEYVKKYAQVKGEIYEV